ncbi:MAG TPA: GrpB family protein, partial [Acidobacteria bacterium]|nr:GrpB family protein [Acidobacteriota bacterium]
MERRVLEVVAYNPEWPQRFEAEQALLREALGGVVVKVHHMGSTAVPGLPAKPIIDLLLEVSDLQELDERTPELEALGYKAKGENGITGRRYFQKGGLQRTHHLHAFKTGDAQVVRHLAFRDYLIGHPEVAREYADLKMRLAAGGTSVAKYQE